MSTLHAVRQFKLHIVAQVVETELVVSAVSNIRRIGFAPLIIVQVVNNDAYTQAEKAVNLSHPFRIAFCEIIVNGHDVYTMTCESVQITRESRDQCLALPSAHLGDVSLVQHHTAHQLHVKVPHVQDAPTCL